MSKKSTKWEKLKRNSMLSGEGFYVSYNPDPSSSELGAFMDWGSDNGGPETALVVDGVFLILNGDFRKEYEIAHPDIEACRAVYEKHKGKHDSSWSRR